MMQFTVLSVGLSLPSFVALFVSRIAIVSPSDPISVAAKKMREYRVNSVVIMTGSKIHGILTYYSFLHWLLSFQTVTLCQQGFIVAIAVLEKAFWCWFLSTGCCLCLLLQLTCSSKDILMRVVAQNLSPELTLVEKVVTKLLCYNCWSYLYMYVCVCCIDTIHLFRIFDTAWP